MRFHRPKRRQSASTSTWPPCAVAWSELVRRRCRVDFCFVNNGMDTHHHKGDVAASTISPAIAFLFTRLRIGVATRSLAAVSTCVPKTDSASPASPNRHAVVALPPLAGDWNRGGIELVGDNDGPAGTGIRLLPSLPFFLCLRMALPLTCFDLKMKLVIT